MKKFGKITVSGNKYQMEAEEDTEDWILYAACVRFGQFMANTRMEPPFEGGVKHISVSTVSVDFRIVEE